MLSGHRTVKCRVLYAQVVYDHGVKSGCTVPRQTVQIVSYRVQPVSGQHSVFRILDFVFAGYAVIFIKIDTQISIVAVSPLRRFPVPRQASLDQIKAAEQVVP